MNISAVRHVLEDLYEEIDDDEVIRIELINGLK